MTIVLTPDCTARLQAQPEAGMGYQHVAVELQDGRTLTGTVLNAKTLTISDDIGSAAIVDIRLRPK